MAEPKTSYIAGSNVAQATNPVGDNIGANFARGFMAYHDKRVAAERNAKITEEKEAFVQYLLDKQRRT